MFTLLCFDHRTNTYRGYFRQFLAMARFDVNVPNWHSVFGALPLDVNPVFLYLNTETSQN